MRGGWFHSGDAAVVHPDGYVEIRDRFKDVIISGGENVSSVEVEGVLLRHPGVQEAAVVGLPHEKWGEAPHAFVVRRPGARSTRRSCSASRASASPASRLPRASRSSTSSRRRPPARSRSTCCGADAPRSLDSSARDACYSLSRMKKCVWVCGVAFALAARSRSADDFTSGRCACTRARSSWTRTRTCPRSSRRSGSDLAVRNTVGHIDIPRWREGGVTAPFLAAYVQRRLRQDGRLREEGPGVHRPDPPARRGAPEGPGLHRLGRRDPPGQEGRQDRDPDRHRGRPRHRGLARRALRPSTGWACAT